MEELNDTRVKWYDIGLQLRMSVGTLDAIKEQYDDPSDCLREALKTWLKTCPSPPTWKNIVDTLRRITVGEVRLAADLEQKYCSTQYTYTYPTNTSTHLLVLPAPPAPLSKALTQTTPPTQYTISPTQPPVLAYSVTPPSQQPPPWSAPYYHSQHTSFPLPLTPSTSEIATTSIVRPSYSQISQVNPTLRPFLPSVPVQLTTPQIPTIFFYYPSAPSLIDTPQDTSPIPPSNTVTTPPHLPPQVATHTLGMQVLSQLRSANSVSCFIQTACYCMGSYIGACSTVIALILCILKI